MHRLFLLAFGIRSDELRLVQTFFALFGAVGVFVTVGVTCADTLFLSRYPAAEAEKLLPFIYVGIGFVGVSVASAFERIREKLPRPALLVGAFLALAASLVGFRVALQSGWKPLFFLLVIWIEVCSLLAVALVFAHAADTFSGRDAKRLYGYITGGLAVGTIVSGYAVEPLVERLKAEGLLIVCAGSLVAAAGIGALTFRLRKAPPAPEAGEGTEGAVPLRALFSNRYLLLAFTFGLAALLCSVLTDYQLKIVASRSMDEAALAAFFGKFYAWLGVAQLVIQFLLVGAILRRLGLLNGLLILPSLVLVAGAGFVVFPVVLMAACLEFVRESFSSTLETPSKELLYLPLPARLRIRAQSFSSGALEAGGQALAGLLIVIVMKFVPGVRWLGVVTLAVAGGWLFAARRLRPRYEEVLAASLREQRLGAADLERLLVRPEAESILTRMLEEGGARAAFALELLGSRPLGGLAPAVAALAGSGGASVAARAVALLGEDRKKEHLPVLRQAAGDDRQAVRAAAVLALCQVAEEDAVHEVEVYLDDVAPPVREAALAACLRYAGERGMAAARPRLDALLRSIDPRERATAARVIGRVSGRGLAPDLAALLADPDPSVRDEALVAARAVADPTLLPILCGLLSSPRDHRAALAALANMPPETAETLATEALSEQRPFAERRALAEALAAVGGEEACRSLLELTRPGEPLLLRLTAARSLLRLVEREKRLPDAPVLDGRLEELLATIELLNRAVGECAGGRPAVSRLLKDHARLHAQLLFALLALRHPADQIRRAEANLFSEDARLQSNALELIDAVLPRALSARLSPQLAALTSEPATPGADLSPATRAALETRGGAWLRALAGYQEKVA